jgi:hypothetical protein
MLNFDPKVWLAQNANLQAPLAKTANRLNVVETGFSQLATLATSQPENENLHPDGNGPNRWGFALAGIDPNRPAQGFDPAHWRGLVADAIWLCRVHGDAAHRLGWSASDLFGIGLSGGMGGLADYLTGARHLAFTDTVAHWRNAEGEGWLWRKSLDPKPLLWEA